MGSPANDGTLFRPSMSLATQLRRRGYYARPQQQVPQQLRRSPEGPARVVGVSRDPRRLLPVSHVEQRSPRVAWRRAERLLDGRRGKEELTSVPCAGPRRTGRLHLGSAVRQPYTD